MELEPSSNLLSPGEKIPPSPRVRRRPSVFVAVLCWGYFLVLVGLVVTIRITGDRNWFGTLLLFSPRWVALLPLAILLPLSLLLNRRMLIVLLISSAVAIFPLMGFSIGWHRFIKAPPDGLPIRVMAFNVHQHLQQPAFAKYFDQTHADIVSLEEMPPVYNHDLFPSADWHVDDRHDELFLASRYPIIESENLITNIATRFVLQSPKGPIDFIVVHLSSPHYALKDAVTGADQGDDELKLNIRHRTDEANMLSTLATKADRPLIIAGDFNLVFDSPLFAYRFSGMQDSFESTGMGFGWTYSNHWTTVRIDHILSNHFFQPTAFSKGPFLGSQHFPIVADLVLKPQ
jgi:endonuclease/exonuclease/phosphatase (EEP) superfamily protein YafD